MNEKKTDLNKTCMLHRDAIAQSQFFSTGDSQRVTAPQFPVCWVASRGGGVAKLHSEGQNPTYAYA